MNDHKKRIYEPAEELVRSLAGGGLMGLELMHRLDDVEDVVLGFVDYLRQNPKEAWSILRESLPSDSQDGGGSWHGPSLRCDGCQDTYDHWDGK